MATFESGRRVKCPHCMAVVKLDTPQRGTADSTVSAGDEYLGLHSAECPSCRRLIVSIEKMEINDVIGDYVPISEHLVWPFSSGRPPAPPQVTTEIAQDFNEAALVLPFSPKASAALSRRCLQSVLREMGGTNSKDLADQIEEIIPKLPTYIAENLDAVRNIGNFAAHEQKSKNTGAILDVEPEEAEWNLDVLESLFDFYYVKPDLEAKKQAAMNEKLAEAGKPPLKKPSP